MVIGALDHRHSRYLAFLADGEPPPGRESIVHLFRRLADWMQENAPNGCMSINAFTAYPGNQTIRDAVKHHKDEIIQLMGRRSCSKELSRELFLIHEGASAAWSLIGMPAIEAAETAALKLINGGTND